MAPIESGTPRSGSRVWGSLALGLLLVLSAMAAWRWLTHSGPSASPNAVESLVQRCEAEMLRGTCRVQTGPPSSSPLDTVVFVAGVGAIDAAAYRQLRDSGEALCSTVRQACQRDWGGASCRAARALHGER